jgi:PPOX class probable F420-dependent enzyme
LGAGAIYSAIDLKPKRMKPLALRRVKNIAENQNVCLAVDEYDEDWRKLRYVMVQGTATLLNRGREHRAALSLLRKKYRQYRYMKLENRPIIKIKPLRTIAWKPTPSDTQTEAVKPKEYH